MSSGHFIQKCEQCSGVVAQCRCMSCDKTVIVKGLCAKCAAQPQEQRSAEQQPTTAAGTPFVQGQSPYYCHVCGRNPCYCASVGL